MKNLLSLAALGAAIATMLTSSSADARIPADRIVVLTPDWAINKARQADTYLITIVDSAGRVVRLCGNASRQCVVHVYRNNETTSPEQ
jgi:diaminopimelate epimerase